jgi:hypothetical protein
MSDTNIATAVGASTALLGIAIGWLLNLWTVNHTVKRQEFYKAAAAFRAAFIKEFRALKAVFHPEAVEPNFVMTTLLAAEVRHERAYLVFQPYLSKKSKRQFDIAWKEYRCPEGGEEAELPSTYNGYCRESQNDVSDCIKLVLAKLDRLMEFASPISNGKRLMNLLTIRAEEK